VTSEERRRYPNPPDYARRNGTGPGGFVIVYCPGFSGDRSMATLSPNLDEIHPASLLAFMLDHPGDHLITVGHPLGGREDEYYDGLFERLQDFGDAPVIFVGLSRGGQVMNEAFRRWRLRGGRTGLVLISTPPTAACLKPHLRLAVHTLGLLPVSLGRLFARYFGGLLARDNVKALRADRQLGEDRRRYLIRLAKHSGRRSVWVVQSLKDLARSKGLGGRLETGGCVIAVNLLAGVDNVLDVDATLELTRRSYPDLVTGLAYELLTQVHGEIMASGRLYSEALADARRHLARIFAN
jgi:hypothetical protein